MPTNLFTKTNGTPEIPSKIFPKLILSVDTLNFLAYDFVDGKIPSQVTPTTKRNRKDDVYDIAVLVVIENKPQSRSRGVSSGGRH